MRTPMKLSDFNFNLPEELIARYPLEKRSASRLLCLDKTTGVVTHRHFTDLLELISPNDLLVCNNSRVIPARLFGTKESGGKIEMLVERILDDHRILAQIRASKSPKPQSYLLFSNDARFKVLGRADDLYELECQSTQPVLHVIETIGEIPLPHYFHRTPEASDIERYQTIYAQNKGSVAAPTAGLHFDEEMFSELKRQGVEINFVMLHVGAGTFASVRVDQIDQHKMHAEYIEVSAALCEQVKKTKARGGRVIAVGTTSARCLETASRSGVIEPYSGDTDIFIYPGFQFQCVDALITNFHLPCSTLLMLVTAFGGYQNVMSAYQQAVQEKYRFYSYGDAMFVF